jgi:acyl carrier protein
VPEDQLISDLLRFIRTHFLDGDALDGGAVNGDVMNGGALHGGAVNGDAVNGDAADGLTDETPLLAWGILDSFKTAKLLTFIEDELGTQIPPAQLFAGNFRDIRSIAAMVRANGDRS